MKPAFTLIESLLIIALAGLLVALLLPVIGNARYRAQDMVSMANMRTHAATIHMYASDWNEYFPCVARPDVTMSIIRGCGGWGYIRYFEATEAWPIALADSYYEGQCYSDVFRHPAYRGDGFTSYTLSSAFLADPLYWDLATRTGPDQWGAQTVARAAFPSAKATLVEWHPVLGWPDVGPPLNGAGLGLADGSVARFSDDEMIEPVLSGEGIYPSIAFGFGVYGLHTPQGVLGRDVVR